MIRLIDYGSAELRIRLEVQMDDREFSSQLRTRAMAYIEKLETLFGPRDTRFQFGKVCCSTNKQDTPQTFFREKYHTNGGCIVDIHVSSGPWNGRNEGHAAWQIAHECVHLLDPVKRGSATVLEEGICTWFQDETKFHENDVNEHAKGITCRDPDYIEARDLVRSLIEDEAFISFVRDIRRERMRISEISSQRLDGFVADSRVEVTAKDLLLLCKKFKS